VADAPKKTAPKQEAVQIKVIPSLEPKLGRVYSNFVQISHTKYDFTIRFADGPPGGDLERLREGDTITIPNIVEIVIVPDLIPPIIKALETGYKNFIAQFGDAAEKGKRTKGN